MALAVPARPVPFVATQPDGTELTLTLIGDERFHYFVTEDGIAVLQECNGTEVAYFYATVKDDVMVPSSILAHSKGKRNSKEKRFIKSQKETVEQCIERKKSAMRNSRISKATLSGENLSDKTAYTGQKRGLVILVNFTDVAMDRLDPQQVFDRQFNEMGYSDNGHIGSVHDYFHDQSYGQFDLTFDVAGPVTVSNELSYYGRNDNATGNTDIRIGRMVTEACKLADKEVNYSLYDWDGDGVVEQVFIIYAGYGESSGAPSYTIWPHKYSLTKCQYWGDGDGALYLDGVKVDTYACSCELSGNSGNVLDGIGTACHEFSHCLGLPDLYDVDYSGAFGMNSWDIMDSGSYSGPKGNGEVPYGYSAYEKACAGWLNLIELDSRMECSLPPLNDNKIAYRVSNNGNTDEFFVLENHQNKGWYSYFGRNSAPHGMMITHIDYNSNAWSKNAVNTYPSHMRASIVPADMDYGTYISESKRYDLTESDYAGDLFPGNSDATRFSSKTYEKCGGKLFNTNSDGSYYLNMTIENITEEDGIISFTIGENLDAPMGITATQNGDKLYIQWDAVEDAVEYSAEILRIKSLWPMKIETEIIEWITDTFVEVEYYGSKQVNVRLRARNGYVTSEWSETFNANIYTNGISTPPSAEDSSLELYTIEGIRIKSPQKQGIYIRNSKNRKEKIYIRQ